MSTDICEFSGCYETIQTREFACSVHMLEWEDGDLDQCTDCDNLKYVDEPICVDCAPGVYDDPESEGAGSILAWEPEPDDAGFIEERDGTGG